MNTRLRVNFRASAKLRSFKLPLILISSVVLLSQPTNALLGQDLPELEPSLSFFGNFEDQNAISRHLDEGDSEADWELDKSCRYVTMAGKIFNQSLSSEIQSRNSRVLTSDSKLKIFIPDPDSTDWILLDQSRNSIFGVPLFRHRNLPHNIVVSVLRNDDIIFTLPCVVDVVDESNPEAATVRSEHLRCAPNEPMVTIAVTLHVSKEQLDTGKRVQLIQDFSNAVVPKIDPSIVTLSFEDGMRHHAFLSGHGNVAMASHATGATLSWPVACGSDSTDLTGLDSIEEASRNGSLAKTLGYDVLAWRAENRKPYVMSYQTSARRFRRRTNDHERYRSPVVHYPAAKPVGIHNPSQEYEKAPYDAMSDDPAFDDNYWASGVNGRKRIPLANIRASPVVGFPTATRFPNPDSLGRKLPTPPSTPAIFPTLGDPPEKNAGVDDIRVQGSTYFEYAIPDDTFMDPNSGNTRSLTLSLIDLSSFNPLDGGEGSDGSDTWLLLDQSSQIVYGVPPRPKASEAMSSSFILMAEDESKRSATDTFDVSLVPRPRPTNHRFTMVFSNHNTSRKSNALASAYAKKLSFALGSRWEAVAAPGHYTMLKITRNNQQLTVTWFDNSLGSKNRCDGQAIDRTWSKMASNELDPSMSNQRSKPKSSFARKFLPEFTLRSVKLSTFGPCVMVPETTTEAATLPTIPPPPPTPPTTLKRTTTTTKARLPSPPPITMLPRFTTTKKTTTTSIPAIESTTTTVLTTSTTAFRQAVVPKVNDQEYTFRMSCHVGVICEYEIPQNLFTSPMGEVRYRLVAWGDGTPLWVAVEPRRRVIVALPTLTDLSTLDQFTPGKATWKGGLVAIDQSGRPSSRVPVHVTITLQPQSDNLWTNINHRFTMSITNYQLQNFTASDSARLLGVISSLYNDPSENQIYVHPLQAGSVKFSWHNITLSKDGDCPYQEIATIAMKLFESTHKLKADVQNRLNNAGFKIDYMKLERLNACQEVSVGNMGPKMVDSVSTTTVALGEPFKGAGADGVTSIVIIAVALVCLIALVVIMVVKYKLSKKAKQKRKEKKRLQSAAATAAVMPPSSPYHLDDKKHSNGNTNCDTRLLFKPGTPIVFDGEDESRLNGNSPLLQRQTSSFTQPATHPSPPANGGLGVITESTPLTPRRDSDSSRPPPPPYVRK